MRKSLAEIVVAEGLVDEARLDSAEKQARRSGEPLIVTLVALERIPELALAVALGRHLKLSIVEPTREPVEPEALREVAHELARRRRLLPLTLEIVKDSPRTLKLAMADPTDRDAIAEVEISTGCRVVPVLGILTAIEEAIAQAYRGIVTQIMRPDEAKAGGAPPDPVAAPRRVPFGADLAVSTPALPHLGAGLGAPGPGTEPFHRLEDELAIELRHQALLELLQRKGVVTPEEYLEEIRKLLRSRE